MTQGKSVSAALDADRVPVASGQGIRSTPIIERFTVIHEIYDPYGRTVPGVNYLPAYERARRLTAIFCKRTDVDGKMPKAFRFYSWVWDRTAADIEGKIRRKQVKP